jgi:arylsulfatase A-like enzyme
MNTLSRRDFLNILGLLSLSYFSPPTSGLSIQGSETKNILVIVFDAFSHHNISLYGYPRRTTPFLELLAEKATVFHNHYAAGNFTTSGTASLLTGTYPWSHRALQINGKVLDHLKSRNLFRLFDEYYKVAYSHNPLVNFLLDQFLDEIDYFKSREDLTLGNNHWLGTLFGNDQDTATISWARISGQIEDHLKSSLFLSDWITSLDDRQSEALLDNYPRGLPISSLDKFLLEDAIDWLQSASSDFFNPFLGYFHFLPPHAPYHTRIDFIGALDGQDHFLKTKPRHALAKVGRANQSSGFNSQRLAYDEYILYVDSEFRRLYTFLEESRILENTYLVLTSDHGEMFERGIIGHTTPSLHNPVVKVPLLIFEPGQTHRKDVFQNTSAVDLLPTFLTWADKTIPDWLEGTVLPPYQTSIQSPAIYAVEAKTNQPDQPLTAASAMIIEDRYKLTKYYGYRYLPQGDTLVELYDIKNDPEELEDLSAALPGIKRQLLSSLEEKIASADKPYT